MKVPAFPRFRRLIRNRRGLAALEFALVAPLLVLLLFGSVELTEVLNCNRRAENTTASLADIVARDTEITNQELADLWSAASSLMFPNSTSPLKMRISSVRILSATQAQVLWSDGYNGYTARAPNSPITLPAGMMTPNTSIIVAETSYQYTPPIGVFLNVAFPLDHIEYRRPRIADPVTRG